MITLSAPWFENVNGSVQAQSLLSQHTWLGVGGKADWLFEPETHNDLQQFLQQYDQKLPLTVIGAGSNLLVRDGGIEGVVIRLKGEFEHITHDQDILSAGAGATDANVARYAAKQGRAGLAFMIGIPGTIGGGLRMNAGCYGSEFKDVLISASGFARDGTPFTVSAADLKMEYRRTAAPDSWIFTSATFATTPGEPDTLRLQMKEMIASRADAQPVGSRTGGSTFANPDGHKAWQVIDAAGCRGLRIGNAYLSEKHCNFLINEGQATAAELEQLGEEIRKRVKQHSGIELRWEIKRVGRQPTLGGDADVL